ncbi:putative membrane protein [Orientia tsutsugamushi str. UT144]|uniref:Putative membrane protein n=1 Tax=Orientia tsutsugamushi str. UT144 TaxID=1441384 RepID=A0A0F3RJ80_ORITS|nr:putative membrane protein [Orientia tsutsugamushi str. UT144]KJW07736.1 putative membrane protein [Orientia tsutsugamushi str. UT144]
MPEIKLNLRPNRLRLFRYLSAIILNRFSIQITFSLTTHSPANLRLFFLSFLVKGFFLLFFFGNSELL